MKLSQRAGLPKLVIIRPMMFSTRVVISMLVAASGVGVVAQTQWLPPAIEQGLAEQLAGRLTSIESRPAADPAAVSDTARKTVKGIGEKLGSWTDRVAIERTPAFPQLTVPTANEAHLDAMAGYQICTMALFMRFESSTDAEGRRKAALGLTATTMAVLRLRPPFVAAGGTDQRIQAFLTSAPLGSVLEAMQGTADLLAHVEGQCQPLIRDLLSGAGG